MFPVEYGGMYWDLRGLRFEGHPPTESDSNQGALTRKIDFGYFGKMVVHNMGSLIKGWPALKYVLRQV